MQAEQRSVLITGGAERIGRTLSLGLSALGWHVLIHYNQSEAPAEELADTIRQAGGTADTLPADLAQLAQVEMLASAAAARATAHGAPLAALINNAARFHYDTLDSMEAAGFDDHVAVNLRAPLFLSRSIARLMEPDCRPGGGCIINILDNKIQAPNPDYFTYTVAKVALAALTGTLALALAPHIRVCGIAPGITLPSGGQNLAEFEKAHKANPLGHGCTPGQVVDAVRFILDMPALTGQTIVIDGGQSLTNPGRDVAFISL